MDNFQGYLAAKINRAICVVLDSNGKRRYDELTELLRLSMVVKGHAFKSFLEIERLQVVIHACVGCPEA